MKPEPRPSEAKGEDLSEFAGSFADKLNDS